jgi:drug/metabolite transporter (DMT)-like permease
MLLVAAGVAGEFSGTPWSHVSVRSLVGLAYLTLFGSVVAYTAYTWLLQRCSPTLVATHTYANPLVAMLLGRILASEPLNAQVLFASPAILIAVGLIRRAERSGHRQASAPGERTMPVLADDSRKVAGHR